MNTTNISNCVEDSRGPSSSDVDPSSSEQSADTVIYVGHNRSNNDETDGEHPPVYIPSLTSGDNRAVMSKALPSKPLPKQLPQTKLLTTSKSVPASPSKHADTRTSSPSKSSKTKSFSAKSSPCKLLPSKAQVEEQWIDGPKISRSKVAEARMNIKKEKEMWVDGPRPSKKHERHEVHAGSYGFLDSHKKNMIRKWVENQTMQVQQKKAGVGQSSSSSSGSGSGSGGSGSGGSGSRGSGSGLSSASATYRGLTKFKTCDEDDDLRCMPVSTSSLHFKGLQCNKHSFTIKIR